ncbi:DNA replication licensing factor MCM5 [Nematocida sp. AWRm77]|nr:DNA replication licensing factor MCM5 [Nematocida sp. AWRm77]
MQSKERIYELGLGGDENGVSDDQMKNLFVSFVDTFRIGTEYIYRAELAQEQKVLQVALEHIGMFDARLYENIMGRPLHYLEMFRTALYNPLRPETDRYIELVSQSTPLPIRKLDSNNLSKIVCVRGIVLSVFSVTSKPVSLYVFCKVCLNSKVIKTSVPAKCEACSGADTFVVVPEKSTLQDSQIIKLQEMFEDLPTGDIPRHIVVSATGSLVDRGVPGNIVTLTGVCMPGTGKANIMYIQALGMSVDGKEVQVSMPTTIREHQAIPREIIVSSIAPEVFGHQQIKLALACALFGGVRRTFEDGICVRGDINVLLLGDPGIAKSQMLKFLSNASERGVYTSGKGASAAGLTAVVCKDKFGSFYLEGGALVLADGGMCCIDEFDKMQEKDRVAIHEAMEQQTISISKAGIVTSLNSRCSVVAAANPIFGRYNENKAPGENIDFGATILSRFDLVFVIKDSLLSDRQIAGHVLSRFIRQQKADTSQSEQEEKDHLSLKHLKEYVSYAKTIQPAIEEEAAERLQSFYIQTRKMAKSASAAGECSIPITVRQLEAITRISEALARMELESVVTSEHVEDAIMLFTNSTLQAVAMGHSVEGMPRKEWIKEFTAVELAVRKALPIGVSKPYSGVLKELCKEYSETIVQKCLEGMIRGEKLTLMNGRKTVVRLP